MLALGLVGLGVGWQRSGIFASPLVRVDTARRELALTFDDGPDPEVTPQLLRQLEAGGHRGTFFVVGSRAKQWPELLREIFQRGHGLGNHSLVHSHLTPFRAPKRLAKELAETSRLLQEAGETPRWFRAPVGLLSPRVAQAAELARLAIVGWTASARDGRASSQMADGLRRLEPHIKPGAILVLHDGAVASARLAPGLLAQVLALMEERGLKSVTLDRLVAVSASSGHGAEQSGDGAEQMS